MMKRCSQCNVEKPLTDFYAQKDCRDGHRPDCKDCWRAKVKARRDANLEGARATDKKRYDENPKRRAAQMATARAHYANNRAHHLANRKAYYEAHRDQWGVYGARRRAREFAVEHQPYTRRAIYDRDGGLCKGCGLALPFKKNGFHIDHIVPISLAGPDTPANVQLMCGPCNRKKWNKLAA